MYKCHLLDPTKDDKPVHSQRAAIDRPKSSCARHRDEKDDNDGGDDDTDDPTYEQDKLTGSQLADAPQGTQTQVCVPLATTT